MKRSRSLVEMMDTDTTTARAKTPHEFPLVGARHENVVVEDDALLLSSYEPCTDGDVNEPPGVYPGRRHYFRLDFMDLLDAYVATGSTDYEDFRREFEKQKIAYLFDFHSKEVPSDVIAVMVDTIYDIALSKETSEKYGLPCVYLLYLLYYAQLQSDRYMFPISMNQLKCLVALKEGLSGAHPKVEDIFNRMVEDQAFAVSARRCATTVYFNGQGFLHRLRRQQENFPSVKKCKVSDNRLLSQDGSLIVDFKRLEEQLRSYSDKTKAPLAAARRQFESYKEFKVRDLPPSGYKLKEEPPRPERVKYNSANVGIRQSIRMGIPMALEHAAELGTDDFRELVKRSNPAKFLREHEEAEKRKKLGLSYPSAGDRIKEEEVADEMCIRKEELPQKLIALLQKEAGFPMSAHMIFARGYRLQGYSPNTSKKLFITTLDKLFRNGLVSRKAGAPRSGKRYFIPLEGVLISQGGSSTVMETNSAGSVADPGDFPPLPGPKTRRKRKTPEKTPEKKPVKGEGLKKEPASRNKKTLPPRMMASKKK